jgi:DNA polymerase-3 subunit delta'
MKEPAGNQHIRRLLLQTIKSDKVAHAYFFSGQDGIGKKLHAIEFAMMLNCAGSNLIPCRQCNSCQKIMKNIHPDLKIVSTEKKLIKLDAIKDIQGFALTRPFEGKYKVIIIDDAHKMNLSASNALLKTLEEPSAGSIIILVSQNPKSLPPTIVSRCIKINFSDLEEEDLESVLLALNYEPQKIKNILPLSSGSLKQALTYLEEDTYGYVTEAIAFLSHLGKKKFTEISAFSERTAQKNLEHIFFHVSNQFYSLRIKEDISNGDECDKTNLFNSLVCHEKTVSFIRLLRYNISKAFLIEAFLLTLTHSEET